MAFQLCLPIPFFYFAQVPDLVELYQRGETMLDEYITHRLPFDGACCAAQCSLGRFCKAPSSKTACPLLAAWCRPSRDLHVRAWELSSSHPATHLGPHPSSSLHLPSEINKAFELLHGGQCLRCVLTFQ